MASRARIGGLVIGWLIVIGLLVATFVFYGGTRLSQPHRLTGFPQMPLYGAITWWFFLAIPMIGLTYGVLNEWRKK
jgi:p-aminobenzoyl-glutamate transporter AbgT